MPDRTMPSKVPAPPMLAMPTALCSISLRCSKSAPMTGPATPRYRRQAPPPSGQIAVPSAPLRPQAATRATRFQPPALAGQKNSTPRRRWSRRQTERRGSSYPQLPGERVDAGKARRNDAAAKVDCDNRLRPLAGHFRPQPTETEEGERMHRDHALMRYAPYRNIDQSADDDRHHQQQGHLRA